MVVLIPFRGIQSTLVATKNVSSKAKKKEGMDTPVSEKTVQKLSNAPYFFTADFIPTKMEIMKASEKPTAFNKNVFQIYVPIISLTSCLCTKDLPKSPFITRSSQFRY